MEVDTQIKIKGNVYQVVSLIYDRLNGFNYLFEVTEIYISGNLLEPGEGNSYTVRANTIDECFDKMYAGLYLKNSIPPKNE